MVRGKAEATRQNGPDESARDSRARGGDREQGDGNSAHVELCASEEDRGAGDGGDSIGKEEPRDEEDDHLPQLQSEFDGAEEGDPGEGEVSQERS